jgi:hypothetical protein
MAQEKAALICNRCGVAIVPRKVVFEYLGRTYSHEVPSCPVCKKVYISKDLAEGRMSEIEKMLEDK